MWGGGLRRVSGGRALRQEVVITQDVKWISSVENNCYIANIGLEIRKGVADIVMAYIVIAYMVMAYMVMAYIVMAYTVMVGIVIACIVMACIIMA